MFCSARCLKKQPNETNQVESRRQDVSQIKKDQKNKRCQQKSTGAKQIMLVNEIINEGYKQVWGRGPKGVVRRYRCTDGSKMSGTKPPKLACCGRHFMMMVKNNHMHLGFGLPLRWNFHGDKGKKPWGREVTKADLFIKGPEQVAAAEAEEDPPKTVTVTMPIGAAAPTKAWTAPAQTLAVVNSAAAPEPAPAPSPTPAAAPAAAGEQTNADMMAILMSMKAQNEKLAEQIADNDARQELARLKLQDEVEQMKMANDGQQSATAADADRARRMERLQMIDAKKTSPAFTFK